MSTKPSRRWSATPTSGFCLPTSALARLTHQRWLSVGVLIVSGKVRPVADDMPPGGTFVPKPYQPTTLVKEGWRLLACAR